MTIGRYRPPTLGGDVVIFKDKRKFLVAYVGDKKPINKQMKYGEDRVLARRRELAFSVTQMMVADEFYDGMP